MAIHSSKVAAKVQAYMNKNSLSSLQVPWADFYTLVERGAIREAFKTELVSALKKESILISYGESVVAIMKDHAPPNVRHDFK
jgi:hypothetical protein